MKHALAILIAACLLPAIAGCERQLTEEAAEAIAEEKLAELDNKLKDEELTADEFEEALLDTMGEIAELAERVPGPRLEDFLSRSPEIDGAKAEVDQRIAALEYLLEAHDSGDVTKETVTTARDALVEANERLQELQPLPTRSDRNALAREYGDTERRKNALRAAAEEWSEVSRRDNETSILVARANWLAAADSWNSLLTVTPKDTPRTTEPPAPPLPVEEIKAEAEAALAEMERIYDEALTAYQAIEAAHADPEQKRRARNDAAAASYDRKRYADEVRRSLASEEPQRVERAATVANSRKASAEQELAKAKEKLAALNGDAVE